MMGNVNPPPPKKSNVLLIVLIVIIITIGVLAGYMMMQNTQLSSSLSTLQSQHSSLQSQYSSLSSNYTTLTGNYNTLNADYSSLNSSCNALTANYNILSSNYSNLTAQYNSALIDLNLYKSIADMNETQTLASGVIASVSTGTYYNLSQQISYDIPYAGYLSITFNTANANIVWWFFSDSPFTENASEIPNNTYLWQKYDRSGSFDMPVMPGKVYISVIPYYANTQNVVTYAITYHY